MNKAYLMQKPPRYPFSFLFTVLLIVLSSWGYQGHQKISGGITMILPPEMSFLVPGWTDIVRLRASDADYRKDTDPDEGPRHYLDMDNYPEFLQSGRVIQDFDSLVAMYGIAFVIDQGILPWATIRSYDSLVSCFQRNDWQKAALFAADLGHYVGDGHMPMHLTRNYNGQYSGNTGIHSRYESKMISRYGSQISITGDSVEWISDVPGYIFHYVSANYPYVDSILLADNLAYTLAGNTTSDLYYQALWEHSATFTTTLFQQGSRALSSLIYSAWREAGKPVYDLNALPGYDRAQAANLLQNYPNPVWDVTVIPVEVAGSNTRVTLRVMDVTGTYSATLHDDVMASGTHEILWDTRNLPSGIWYCILHADDVIMTRTMVVAH